MTNSASNDALPDGEELERAIVAAKEGTLSGPDFAEVLIGATLMLAVTDVERGESGDAAVPLVVELEGAPYGLAYTSPARWDTFTAQTPFLLVSGRDLGRWWPDSLGLVLNPATTPSLMLTPEQLARLVGAPTAETVPAGTGLRLGAPERGLPEAAVEALRQGVRSTPGVHAAYQLAFAQGEAAPELVIGVEAERGHNRPAQAFAAAMERSNPQFRGVAFLDLNESLLQTAKKHARPIA